MNIPPKRFAGNRIGAFTLQYDERTRTSWSSANPILFFFTAHPPFSHTHPHLCTARAADFR
jgi:hypothetical protein